MRLQFESGKSDAAHAFLSELEGRRKAGYAASEEQRFGISKEVWAIQQTPMGELFVVSFQSPNKRSST